jgi:hypothetical protein
MDSSKIKLLLIVVVAVFASLYLGISAATAQFEAIAWVIGGLTLCICLLLGRSIWVLLPLLTAVNLQLRIPGSPSTLLAAQIIVLGFSFLLVASRKLSISIRLTELEFWMCGLAILVIQVYARNPAGVWIFQSDTVGGKAYFIIAITFVTAIYLCSIVAEEKDLKRILPLVVFGSIINVTVAIIGKFVPILGYYTGAKFSINESIVGSTIGDGRATRFLEVSIFGQSLALWISCLKNPLKVAFDPRWLFLILLSVACALFGGYRSGFAMVIMTYIVGTWYRGGFAATFAGAFAGCCGIALLAIANVIVPLPPNIQRSLTILPGTWEQRYRDDADGSTEWRAEIWKEVLFTDRWIQNKIIGDGLGFTKQQLDYQLSLTEAQSTRRGISGFEMQRESILASGDYHSGPVSTIRVIGYVGLVFVILFQIRLAVHAHMQIIRCRGTEWYPLALLIGIPLICAPVYFHFIFGDFRSEAITLFMGSAMIRLLERGLPLPANSLRRHPKVSPLRAG